MNMPEPSRRRLLLSSFAQAGALGLGPLLPAFSANQALAYPAVGAVDGDVNNAPSGMLWNHLRWARGFEGQRRADLGNGRYLNPVMAGDHPDPAIIKVGEEYFLTFSTFDSYPGLVIYRSTDLINWTAVTAALTENIGSVWAPDLSHHNGKFYLYIPARTPTHRSNYVSVADHIEGPWSTPVDLNLPNHIDPCHGVDEHGQRWLFLSGGDGVRLSDDGLSTIGTPQHIIDPWHYPDNWTVEGFSPEGPKIFRRADYFYCITAVGGTAGPPTSHMVIVSRARSILGPWENCPQNPIIRTISAREKWWSRGHASAVEGLDGRWYLVYHGYENGFWTLGRQMLVEPMEWTHDGWIRPLGGDLSAQLRAPMRRPRNAPTPPHGQPLSDDFTTDRMGSLWSFYLPGPNEAARMNRLTGGGLNLLASGTSPTDSPPLCLVAGDLSYEFTAEIELNGNAEAGILLFYSKRLYAGLGVRADGLTMHRYGRQRRVRNPHQVDGTPISRLFLRLVNDRNILTLYTSTDGENWTKFYVQMEVSGYNHNTDGDFLALKPAIYCANNGAGAAGGATPNGSATFKWTRYRGL